MSNKRLVEQITKGPYDVHGTGLVRAIRGDAAIPLFEPRMPYDYTTNADHDESTSKAFQEEWHNARFAAEAFNTAHASGFSPAELLAQRDGLIVLCKQAVEALRLAASGATYDDALDEYKAVRNRISTALAEIEQAKGAKES